MGRCLMKDLKALFCNVCPRTGAACMLSNTLENDQCNINGCTLRVCVCLNLIASLQPHMAVLASYPDHVILLLYGLGMRLVARGDRPQLASYPGNVILLLHKLGMRLVVKGERSCHKQRCHVKKNRGSKDL